MIEENRLMVWRIFSLNEYIFLSQLALSFAFVMGAGILVTEKVVALEESSSQVALVESSYADFVFRNGVIEKYVGAGGDVVIPSMLASQKVLKIGDGAFQNATAVTSVVIPSTVEEIGSLAFFGCTKLENVLLPSSLKSIGDFGFTGCISLKALLLPEGLESIGRSGFSGTGVVLLDLPNSVTSLGNSAFSGCLSLEKVRVGNGLTVIPSSGFSRCSSLSVVSLGNSVRAIESSGFENCWSLSVLGVPMSLTSVAGGAFQGVEGLSSIFYTGTYGDMFGISVADEYNSGFSFGTWLYGQGFPMESYFSLGHLMVNYWDGVGTGEVLTLAERYVDLNEEEWYYPYIEFAYERGFLSEVTVKTFSPLGQATRGMIADGVYVMGYEDGDEFEDNLFADVPLDYVDSVAWCYSQGVMSGMSEYEFGTHTSLTREQFALILKQLAVKKGDSGMSWESSVLMEFDDEGDISVWARDGVVWAVEQGLMKGNEGILNPQGSVTRSEVAVMMLRFSELFP